MKNRQSIEDKAFPRWPLAPCVLEDVDTRVDKTVTTETLRVRLLCDNRYFVMDEVMRGTLGN